jgi:antirestriction protein ArdC
MANRLCSIVTENVESDYHFHAIMVATKDFQTYNQWYKLYKSTLNYEPGVSAPEKAHVLAEIAKNFKVAETAFQRANIELVQVLGAEIMTTKGSITQLILRRAAKIAMWRRARKLDEGQAAASDDA